MTLSCQSKKVPGSARLPNGRRACAQAQGRMIWPFVVAHSFPRSVAKKKELTKMHSSSTSGYEQWMREGKMWSFIDPARRNPSRVCEGPASEGHFCRSCGATGGADVMKRIGAPMVGGVVTSAAMELLVFPAMYLVWRSRLPSLNRDRHHLALRHTNASCRGVLA